MLFVMDEANSILPVCEDRVPQVKLVSCLLDNEVGMVLLRNMLTSPELGEVCREASCQACSAGVEICEQEWQPTLQSQLKPSHHELGVNMRC